MKTLASTFAALVWCAAATFAQSAAGSSSVQSLKVLETRLPLYPFELLQLGVREGDVRIAFSVDANGRIDDMLPIAYTRREFAAATMAALRQWRFEPARFNGQPIAASTEVSVHFEVEGTIVVSLTPTDTVNARILQMTDSRDYYRPRALKELDRIPTPISAPSPAFPQRLTAPGSAAQVTVTFFIDEQGAVRLPSITANDDPELAAVVIQALRNWKFEPPMCKGRPVLVRASQQFNFRAPTPKAATASNG